MPPFFGIELGMHDRAVGVAFAVADLVGVGVEPDDGLDGVSARLQLVERAGKPSDRGIDSQRFARLPVLDVHGKERLRPEPVRPETAARRPSCPAEKHINPPLDRLAAATWRHK